MTTTGPTKREREIYGRFVSAFNDMAQLAHENAVAKGWWECPDADLVRRTIAIAGLSDDAEAELEALADRLEQRNAGEVLALMHSELSEALEAERDGNPRSEKVPTFSATEEELADVIVRIMDWAASRGMHVGSAIVAKHIYNKGRAHRHGGRKF